MQPLEIQPMELLDSTFKAHKIKMNLICSIDYCWLIISNSTKYGPSSGRMWNNVTNVNVFAYDAQQEYMIPSNNALTNSQKSMRCSNNVLISCRVFREQLGASDHWTRLRIALNTCIGYVAMRTRVQDWICVCILMSPVAGGHSPLDRSWTRVFISCSNNVLTIPQKTSIVISCESFTNARRQAQ